MLNLILGFLIGVFVSWTSYTIGMERAAYIQLLKDENYTETLNERDHYKRFYEKYWDERNSGY